jgi:hypothetical protein
MKKQATGYRLPEIPIRLRHRLSPVAGRLFPIDRLPADQLSGCHTG